MLARTPFLPEDLRYMGTSLMQIEDAAPRLAHWLSRIFMVLGGFIFATGLLTVYVALTSLRRRAAGAGVVMFITGASTAGLMAAVNFVIDSDFKWALLGLALIWASGLVLYWREAPFGKV